MPMSFITHTCVRAAEISMGMKQLPHRFYSVFNMLFRQNGVLGSNTANQWQAQIFFFQLFI